MRVYPTDEAEARQFYYGTRDPRVAKRVERKVMGFDAVHDAYRAGEFQAMSGRPYRNPFPAGRRHDAFKRGFEL